jgi:hypothetical protein
MEKGDVEPLRGEVDGYPESVRIVRPLPYILPRDAGEERGGGLSAAVERLDLFERPMDYSMEPPRMMLSKVARLNMLAG